MGILHRAEIVEVFDRDLQKVYKGRSEEAIEWIMENPLKCETVAVQGVLDLFSIDQYTHRYDRLEEAGL